jgi:hypothetical protein
VNQPSLFSVRLQGVPRPLAEYAVERTEELLREFRLMTVAARDTSSDLPARFAALVGRLRAAADGREMLVGAGLEGWAPGEVLDLHLALPAGAEHDAIALALLLDESDVFCETGQLLTLGRPPALVALRWWQATEVVRQRQGLPPTAFTLPHAK